MVLHNTKFTNIRMDVVSSGCYRLRRLDMKPSEKMPVIFFIHGGGYMSGGSSWYGPEILLDDSVVLVTINYRLGPFGFLSLNTADYSGNMGLKDQLLALKWVNENIESFGGECINNIRSRINVEVFHKRSGH